MNYIDYREKLGIGFCDEQKFKYLKTKVFNVLNAISRELYFGCIDFDEYFAFCDLTGTPMNLNYDESYHQLERFKHCLSVLDKTQELPDFLAVYIAFTNSVKKEKVIKGQWDRSSFATLICNKLDEAHIPFDCLKDNGEYFVFPKGAKELDDVLVSQPLEWLRDYPTAHKTFVTALKQYSDDIYIRDVADNLRKALEAFLQEFLGNEKNLETNKNEICKYLGSQGVDAGISGLFQPLLNAYKNINDRIAKHNDAVDKKLLEFLLYQTGVLIRMVIVVKMEENSHEA